MLKKNLLATTGSGLATDPQFNYVTMLLHGDGTNGAQNNTFVDNSSNFSIARTGSVTQGSFSPYGSNWSNNFNGYLQVANNAAFDFGSGDFTIEFWMNASTLQTGTLQPIINKGTDYSSQYAPFDISQDGTDVKLWLGTSSGWSIAGGVTIGTIVIGQWSHFAVTRSGTTFKAFKDGVQTWTTTSSDALLVNTFPLRLAATSNASAFFNGYLSNVRLVKGTAVYTSAFTPSTTPLTAISGTSVLTCQSNRFVDNSANNFTITAAGSPSVQRFNPFGASTAYSTSVIGGSAFFPEGTGDYLNTTTDLAAIGTNSFTVECWWYPLVSGKQEFTFFSVGNVATASGFAVGTDNGSGIFVYAGDYYPSYSSTVGVMQVNAWNHIAVTRSTSTISIYVNGVLARSGSWGNHTISAGPIYIGRAANGYFGETNGYLSDIRYTNNIVYTTDFALPTSPLEAISGTGFLANFTNGAIYDNAMMNDLQTAGSAQISTSVKKYGTGSMYFDGTGDYLVGNGGQGLGGDFTIEAWVYALGFSGDARVIVDTRDAWFSSTGLNFYFNDAGNLIMYVNGGDRITSATAYSTSTWYFVTLARSGSTITMYVNGASVGTYTYSTALTDKTVIVGTATDNRNTGTAWKFYGYIDDLRITKGYARYTSDFTPPTAAFPNTGPN